MRSQTTHRQPGKVLLLIDDASILAFTKACLAASAERLLMAQTARSALWILRQVEVDSVVMRAGVADFKRVEAQCRANGVQIQFVKGAVEEGIAHFTLPGKLNSRSSVRRVRRCRPRKIG